MAADSERDRIKFILNGFYQNGDISIENGCHQWNKCKTKGYGKIGITLNMATGPTSKKVFRAHVLVFKLNNPHYELRERSNISLHLFWSF